MAQPAFTVLLQQWSQGDASVQNDVLERTYAQLKRIAHNQLQQERANHTLQPTALVHEAYLKLVQGEQVNWQDRVHFFAVAARVIRQILIDSGRRKQAARRQGQHITLHTNFQDTRSDPVDLVHFDQVLNELEGLAPEQARVVELRYFAGLTIDEAAAAMDISTATVERHWRVARAWLYSHLEQTDAC